VSSEVAVATAGAKVVFVVGAALLQWYLVVNFKVKSGVAALAVDDLGAAPAVPSLHPFLYGGPLPAGGDAASSLCLVLLAVFGAAGLVA
jgi:hypothetical protein